MFSDCSLGYTPAVFAKSAETIEKMGDELPRTAPLGESSRGKKEWKERQMTAR